MTLQSAFSHGWYRDFLRESKRLGEPIPLGKAETAPKGAILMRHDVDYDLDAAIALSHIEEESDVRSTFLFLISTDFYNVASAFGRRTVGDLIERGFEVGLHFDPEVHSGSPLSEAFASERLFLESITRLPLRSVSLHNPAAHGSYPLFEGVVNAYDPRWFGPDRYLSDSLRRWRQDPLAFLASDRPGIVQVLTHPIHFSAGGEKYVSQFRRMTESWSDRLHRYALRYNATYRDECKAVESSPSSEPSSEGRER